MNSHAPHTAPTPEDDPSGTRLRYTVAITGSGLYDKYLCLQYRVSPIPPPLRGDQALHEGGEVGIAVDRRRRLHHGCHTAYRAAATGSCVVGVIKIGPATWVGRGPVRVLFPPFAHTPGLDRILCEVRLIIDGTQVRSASIRH